MKKISIKKLEKILNEPESDYLDFKENYTTNYDLLKDILALANSMSPQKNRFLIFGITDKERKLVKLTTKNRKTQTEIIDLLSQKTNKPINFKHYTLHYKNYEIDILQIESYSDKPYFLIKDYIENYPNKHVITEYKGSFSDKPPFLTKIYTENSVDKPSFLLNKKSTRKISAGQIYIRVGDTNRQVADDDTFDRIFKQKFGLDKTPFEKILDYLKNKDGWTFDYDEKNQLYFYYSQHPEYTIFVSENYEPFNEPWSNIFPDNNATKQFFFFKFHNTILKKVIVVDSDGDRYQTVIPERWYYIEEESSKIYYSYYYISNSIPVLLNEMIKKNYIEKRLSKGSNHQTLSFPTFPTQKNAEKNIVRDFTGTQSKYTYYISDTKNKKIKIKNSDKRFNKKIIR